MDGCMSPISPSEASSCDHFAATHPVKASSQSSVHKSSTFMSSSKEGLLLSNQKSSSSSSHLSSSSFQNSAFSSSPKQLINNVKNGSGSGDVNLAVIQEELQVEEGCDNELETNRVTLQKIRQKTTL